MYNPGWDVFFLDEDGDGLACECLYYGYHCLTPWDSRETTLMCGERALSNASNPAQRGLPYRGSLVPRLTARRIHV